MGVLRQLRLLHREGKPQGGLTEGRTRRTTLARRSRPRRPVPDCLTRPRFPPPPASLAGGWRALYAGLSPTMVRAFPANAAQWLAWELAQQQLRRLERHR